MDKQLQAELVGLGNLIDLIYQGATNIKAWHDVPRAISEWIDTVACLVLTPLHAPEHGGFAVMHNVPPQAWELWTTRYLSHDLFAQAAVEKNLIVTNSVLRDQDLVSESEIRESHLYRDILAPNGVGRFMTGIVFSEGDKMMPVACSFHRQFEKPFMEADAAKLRILLPHLSRSLGVMLRLRDAEFKVATSLAALDRLQHGCLLFNTEGKVIFHNEIAGCILRTGDGLRLHNISGDREKAELLASGAGDQNALYEAIREAISPNMLSTQHFTKALNIFRPSGKPPYTLNFSTLPASNEFGLGADVPRAIAFLTDNATEVRLDAALLKSAYGLTGAEIRLAGRLVNGDGLEEAAHGLGVSINTTKTQLAHIYDKTHTRNRAKLVKLLITMMVVK